MKAIGFQSEEIQEYFVLLLLVKCNLLIIKLKITKAQNAKKKENIAYMLLTDTTISAYAVLIVRFYCTVCPRSRDPMY